MITPIDALTAPSMTRCGGTLTDYYQGTSSITIIRNFSPRRLLTSKPQQAMIVFCVRSSA